MTNILWLAGSTAETPELKKKLLSPTTLSGVIAAVEASMVTNWFGQQTVIPATFEVVCECAPVDEKQSKNVTGSK